MVSKILIDTNVLIDYILEREPFFDEVNQSWYINEGDVFFAQTGLAIQMPENTFGLIKPRSGMSAKYGLSVLAGVVDSSYTGEIVVLFTVTKGFSLVRNMSTP